MHMTIIIDISMPVFIAIICELLPSIILREF